MLSPIPQGIAENVVLLLAVALVYDLATSKRTVEGHPARQGAVGLLLGLVAVASMATSLRLEPGLIFDARSVVLAVTGLFFGLVAALPAMAVAAAYRIYEGGPGMWTGVWVILASGLVGLGWRRLRGHRLATNGFGELFLFGVLVHVVMLALMLTLPESRGWEVLPLISAPVLILYPLATALLGLLLVRRLGRDLTSRSLEESESRYRSLFERSQSVMLILDPESGTIVDANKAAAGFYGYPRTELQGMELTRISTLPDAERQTAIEQARSGELDRLHFRHRLADASIRDVEVHGGPITLEGRDLVYAIIHDVTERREAETAIRQQAERLRVQHAALEAAANPMVITNRKGVIQWVNPAFSRLTGYSDREAIGANPGNLVNSGVHCEAFFREMWTTILAGEVWEGEVTNRRKDGTLYRENQTITPIRNPEGEITHFIAVKQDLTDHLELQAQLIEAQKMEAVGRLASGVAHDFNNLLTVISGSAQLALTDAPPDSEIYRQLQEIEYAGKRAASLTRQLLTFGRRGLVARTTVDLNGLVVEMAQLLERLLRDDVTLELRLCPEPTPIEADPSRIEQILMNLSVNARDAMPSGGRLTVQTWIEERGREPDPGHGDRAPAAPGMVVLRVADSGEGMPPEVRERAFEPFFTTKPQGKGTGLGLATVYGIVTQAGGTLSMESSLGKGTTFEIRLPQAEPAPGEDSPPTVKAVRDPTSVASARILLVEDDEGIRKVARKILERGGHTVLSAASGRKALDLLARHTGPIDLVLADVMMPEMTGPELAEKIRERHPRVRVLFSSGHPREMLVDQRAVDADQPFLPKPYAMDLLQAQVQEVLNG